MKTILSFVSWAFIILSTQTTVLYGQECLLQGWYWEYPKTSDGALWADTLVERAMDISNSGITYVWLPPLSRSSSIPNNSSNGYNIKDLFDLGEYGLGPTGFGTRQDVNNVVQAFNTWNLGAVADVIYNHRDGGAAETNISVEGWIENYPGPASNCPYPSDRFRCFLPIGGSTSNNSGDYYIKFSSASQDPAFYGKTYRLYITTNRASATLPYNGSMSEDENNGGNGNGGGDCGQQSNNAPLNTDIAVSIDGTGCKTDEFRVTLNSANYYAAGDTLWVYLSNNNGDYSDHRIYGIWSTSANADVVNQLRYQTYTNFNNMPSGRGNMTNANFKPNGSPTTLCGDSDWPWFFYDYDHSISSTRDTLLDYTRWLWDDVGIRGLRLDAVKHFDASFVSYLLNNMNISGQNPGLVVGESISSATQISDWINAVYGGMTPSATAAIQVRAFDFPLRWSLKNACDQFGYDVRQVFNEGLVNNANQSPFNVVTFINNHDYRNASDAVQNDPMLAYAYLLTNNQVGLPSVFYPDYYGNTLNYMPTTALKPQIDALINVNRQYIYSSSSIDYISRIGTPYSQNFISGYPNTTLLYQLWGNSITGNDVIVAINFAGVTMRLDQTVNTGTGGLAVGDTLVDVLGRSNFPYAIVNNNSQIYVELPPRSYSVWVRCNSPSAPDCVKPAGQRFRGKVWLEGSYNASLNAMSTQLKKSNLLPLAQPYTASPWNYNGTEHVSSTRVLPPNTCDWILVEARRSNDTAVVARQAAFLRADGTIIDRYGVEGVYLEGANSGQDYFIAIKHRNHLPIMSSSPISLNNAAMYDFGQASNVAGGIGQVALLEGSLYGMTAADASSNGVITFSDFNAYRQQFGNNDNYNKGDLNLDGQVNLNDFGLYRQNAGRIALPALR